MGLFCYRESAMQRLTPLKLNPVFNLKTNTMQIVSFIELFTVSLGGQETRRRFSKRYMDEHMLAHWHIALTYYINEFIQIMYPLMFLFYSMNII